jgi:hypothetical protein
MLEATLAPATPQASHAKMNGHALPRVRAGAVPPRAVPFPARSGLAAPPTHASGEPVSQAEIDQALEHEAFLDKVRRACALRRAYERGMQDGRVVGLHRRFWQGFGLGAAATAGAVLLGVSL